MTPTPKSEVIEGLLLLALTITPTTSSTLARTTSAPEPRRVKRTMKPFRSERDLKRYFEVLAEKHRLKEARRAAIARRKAEREARRAAKPSGEVVLIEAPAGEALDRKR